jgi:predicted transcriptional regulator
MSKTQDAVQWLLADSKRSQKDAARMFDVSQPAISQALARRDKTRIGNAELIRTADAVKAERIACAAVCRTLAERTMDAAEIRVLHAAERNILNRSH